MKANRRKIMLAK